MILVFYFALLPLLIFFNICEVHSFREFCGVGRHCLRRRLALGAWAERRSSMAVEAGSPEQGVLQLLRERNKAMAACCATTRMHETLLADCTALEKVALKCERLEQEAEAAKGAEAEAIEATRAMGKKLEEALSKAADLEHSLRSVTASEAGLKNENEMLITRLTQQLQMQASAMDSEREEHEQRLAAQPQELPEQRAGWLPAPSADAPRAVD